MISVIITAYTKRPYIKEAVMSALNQSLKREKYEILMVKNFNDKEIDDWLIRHGVRVITAEETSLGGKIKLGVEEAEGDVISLLEDDDLFFSNKLEEVYEAFNDQELGYYHNNWVNINHRGTIVGGPAIRNGLPLIFSSEYLLTEKNNLINALKRGAQFNNSSISVRKYLIERIANDLLGFSQGVDFRIFLLLLNYNMKFMISEKTLTKYRLHGIREDLSFKRLFKTRIADQTKSFNTLVGLTQHKIVRELLQPSIYRSVLIEKILSESSRKDIIKLSFKLFKSPLSVDYLSSSQPNYMYVLIGLLSLTDPRLTRRMLLRRWERMLC